MAISFSRPDSGSASGSFRTVRRGLDPDEVRERIRSLEVEIERLRERAAQFERELATASRPRIEIEGLSGATLVELVGEEASRILDEARADATGIRQRAEDEAVAIVAAAYEEAARVRESVQQEIVYLQRTTAEQVESELASARARGLEMVTEAREYREKVLADLARRRDLAREQVRALLDGRDHLLRAFEVARLAAVDIIVELEQAVPTEDAVDHDERLAREVAESAIYDADADITPASGTPRPVTSGPVLVHNGEASERSEGAGDDGVPGATPPASGSDVYRTGPLGDRARVLAPLAESLSKQLRRVVADEQNEVLTAIRRSEKVLRIDEVLPAENDHLARFVAAAQAESRDAARLGATSVGGSLAADDPRIDDALAARIAEELVLPMRERLERVVESSQGNRFELSAFVRSAYREWRQRGDQLAEELLLLAHGTGAYLALPEGSLVVWVADPGAPCAEGHSNVGVVIRVPASFPSGHQHPPVSSRCRCLIERVPE